MTLTTVVEDELTLCNVCLAFQWKTSTLAPQPSLPRAFLCTQNKQCIDIQLITAAYNCITMTAYLAE